MFGGWLRRFTILCGCHVQMMRPRIERHGARPALGGHGLHDGVAVGRVLVDHRQRTFTVRAEGEPGRGVERGTGAMKSISTGYVSAGLPPTCSGSTTS